MILFLSGRQQSRICSTRPTHDTSHADLAYLAVRGTISSSQRRAITPDRYLPRPHISCPQFLCSHVFHFVFTCEATILLVYSVRCAREQRLSFYSKPLVCMHIFVKRMRPPVPSVGCSDLHPLPPLLPLHSLHATAALFLSFHWILRSMLQQ